MGSRDTDRYTVTVSDNIQHKGDRRGETRPSRTTPRERGGVARRGDERRGMGTREAYRHAATHGRTQGLSQRTRDCSGALPLDTHTGTHTHVHNATRHQATNTPSVLPLLLEICLARPSTQVTIPSTTTQHTGIEVRTTRQWHRSRAMGNRW